MAKYIVSVHEIGEDAERRVTTQEVFKLGVEEFDALTFCAALKQRTRGRKPAKKGEAQT